MCIYTVYGLRKLMVKFSQWRGVELIRCIMAV